MCFAPPSVGFIAAVPVVSHMFVFVCLAVILVSCGLSCLLLILCVCSVCVYTGGFSVVVIVIVVFLYRCSFLCPSLLDVLGFRV